MNREKRNKSGFTLVEIIFSIAFLSVVSVIVLKLFVSSNDIDRRTETMDIATMYTINEIENVKALHLPSEDAYSLVLYYDEKWQEESSESNASYALTLEVVKNDKYDRGLYDLVAYVFDYENDEELLRIKTKHYYQDKE